MNEALRALIDALGPYGRHVQRVRFIDFKHRKRHGFRFTIALTWTASHPGARQALYDLGPDFARDFGWYPLPQGERIASKLTLGSVSKQLHQRARPRFGVRGDLRRVMSAVPPEGGCAIRVQTTGGSLLLDTGLPGHLPGPASDAMVLLSHVHRDHSGGLRSEGASDLPIITSEATAHSLVAAGILTEAELLRRTVIAHEHEGLRIGNGVSVTAFPVPHCPGASGFVLRDRTSSVFYTGDVCLATARHDFLPDLLARLHADEASRKTVLLDATMAGRAAGASGARSAAAILDLLEAVGDVVLCSRDVSQLLYAHIDLFAEAKSSPATRIGVSHMTTARIRPLMQLLHAAFIDRAEERIDPLLVAQYGRSMSAWAETRWLYWLDHLEVAPADGARVWLVHPDEIEQLPIGTEAVLAWIGRRGPEDKTLGLPEAEVDTTPWTQHSDAATIERAARALSEHARVLLFHNFTKRLDKFIASRGLRHCTPLTSEPVRV